MSITFYIVSLVLIGSNEVLVNFGFVSDDICDSCGKVGRLMNILFTVCAWLNGHGVILGCKKITRVFLSDCWNIFGSLYYFWVLMIF